MVAKTNELFFFFSTGLHILIACTQQVSNVPHPAQIQKRHQTSPYLVYFYTLYPLLFPQLWESSILTHLLFSNTSLSASAAADAVSLSPAKSIPDCSHHRIPTCAPYFFYTTLQRSKIDRVAIYCAAIFYLYQMQVSIGSNPASYISASSKVYSHLLSILRHGSRPISFLINWSWRPPRTRPMLGVTTHVSAPNSNTE